MIRALLRVVLASLVGLGLSGCPPQPLVPDASEMDAPAGDVGTDANFDARRCGVTCSTTMERCCTSDEGVDECIDVTHDVTNCGLCGLDCVATNRGDRCIAMQCSCGAFAIGCTGDDASTCCPPAPDGRTERCANLGRDFGDCGGCGQLCDALQANRCEAGLCRCGLDGDLCAGTETDVCCLDVFDVASCVDTTSDDLNCGGCNRRCGPFEDCRSGVCVDFTIPDAGPFDAAPIEAGPRDAGARDAGSLDAGSLDAGPVDAGTEAGASMDADTVDAASAGDAGAGDAGGEVG